MAEITQQQKTWEGSFGKEYTDRNPQTFEDMDKMYLQHFGIRRSSLNKEFLGNMNRNIRILEVGANVGMQLSGLRKMGFENLYGIELQTYAVEIARKKLTNTNLIVGHAFDIPFKDNYFDLVYTSGLLIHISPDNIDTVLGEIYRCTNKYIWGYEYFSENYVAVESYRGKKNLLWKANFAQLYLDKFSDVEVVQERKIKYLANDNIDSMFLLMKRIH
jgi:pseudaminic acid biosynthesis-associated methylase